MLEFAWLPPEINSARIFAGAGSSTLHSAAAAWEGLGADLLASSSSIQTLLADLTTGPWKGATSVAMAAAAAPYLGWLSAAAAQAELSAAQARAAATVFEAALAATVPPPLVALNRSSFLTLIATNFFGLNTPAIAATEFDYVEMWAQDVGAMVSYYTGATSVAETLTPFSAPPVSLAGLTTQVAGVAAQVNTQLAGAMAPLTAAVSPGIQSLTAGIPAAVTAVQSAASAVPLETVMGVAQSAAMPASMLMGPLMQMGQSANAGTAGLAGAGAEFAGMPMLASDVNPMKGLGGGGMGAGMAADLGKAHLVGAMSVPANWEGSMPKGMSSSAMAGLGGMPSAAAMEAAAAGGTGGGMPMMPMPMGGGGAAGGGMPGGMMGRGGANPHVVQGRPSVIPRSGVG